MNDDLARALPDQDMYNRCTDWATHYGCKLRQNGDLFSLDKLTPISSLMLKSERVTSYMPLVELDQMLTKAYEYGLSHLPITNMLDAYQAVVD